MRRILVTGFEPFGDESRNPSAELAALLDDQQKRLFEPPYIWRRENV